MAKGLSFSAVLKLQKQQFDAGIREVKRSLNDLKSTFTQIAGALGAGLGLASFIGNMKETAVQLSVVKATLENVSKSTEEYGESLEFLRRIANAYGQDQNALTMSFAKFSAAATGAGVELDQVKSIFESLTRAAGAYHLSAESTASVMLAVEQMFSKGKVAAEELRRQLGNSLPGAFNIMAKAAGEAGITLNGTAAELDKAMKAGQVMASEVMPYFARELDKATTGANFDSLQSSLNRLSNSWYNFVEETNMEGAFDGLVKAGAGALNLLTNGFKILGISIRDIGIVVAGGLGFKMLEKSGTIALENMKAEFDKLVASSEKMETTIASLELKLAQLKAMDPAANITMGLNSAKAAAAGLNTELVDTLTFLEMFGKTVNERTITAAEGIKYLETEVERLKAELDAASASMLKLGENAVKGETAAGRAMIGLQNALKGLLGTLKAVAGMIAFTFAVSLVFKFIDAMKEAYAEIKRINEIPTKAVENAEAMTDATKEQIGALQKQVDILKYYTQDEQKRLNAINEINKALEKEEGNLFNLQTPIEEIEKAVNDWGNGIAKSAEALQKWEALQEVEQTIGELNAQIARLKDTEGYGEVVREYELMGGHVKELTKRGEELYQQERKITIELNAQLAARQALIDAGALQGQPTPGVPADQTLNEVKGQLDAYKRSADELATQKKNGALNEKEYQKELQKTQTKVFKQISTYEDLDSIVTRLDKDHKQLFTDIKNGFKAGQSGGGGGGSAKKTPIQQLADTMDGYITKITELQNQLKNGVITQEEYDKQIVSIAENAEKSVGAFEDMGSALDQLGNKYKDFFDTLKVMKEGAKKNIAFEELFEEAKKSIEKSTDELMDNLEKYFDKSSEIMAKGMPELKSRNSFFDYKKSDKEIGGEKASNMEDYVKDLQDMRDELIALSKVVDGGLDPVMQDFLDQLNEKLKEATKNAKDLRQKAQLAELADDMEKFTKAVRDAKFESIKEVASSFDRLVKSIESVASALEDLDKANRTPLDDLKLLASMISELIQLITTFKSVIEGFNEVQEAMANKRKAENAQMLVQAGAVIAAQEAQVASETKSAAATVAAESTKQAAMAKTTTAEAGSAIAGAASSVASVPYVGPILAAAAVASMVALFAANLKKFAGGGIVNGPANGDRNLVRTNGGEMILNKHQQATLFNMLNGKGGTVGGGGAVDFKIRGADLVGVLNNYQGRVRG